MTSPSPPSPETQNFQAPSSPQAPSPQTPKISFDRLKPEDYDRAKRVLNKARNPGFVGRELFYRCATAGLAAICVVDDEDAGVALIHKDKLQALSVDRAHQGRGIGQALMDKYKPRWVNAIGEKVTWFENLGYMCVGAAAIGRNGKHATQLLERLPDDEIIRAEIRPFIEPEDIQPIPVPEQIREAIAARKKAAEEKANRPKDARQEAEKAVLDDSAGRPVDWEAVARRTLGDVMAHGEDKDRVSAARGWAAIYLRAGKEREPADDARELGGEELVEEMREFDAWRAAKRERAKLGLKEPPPMKEPPPIE